MAIPLFMKAQREKSNLNRLDILKQSYRLMAENSWDSISVTTLEKNISQTRGAIFYFNKNKNDLFVNIIDELFFPVFAMSTSQRDKYSSCSARIFFATYRTAFERVMDDLSENYGFANPSKNLLNIIIQAQSHYPGFTQKLKTLIISEIDFVNQIIGVNNRYNYKGDDVFIQSAGKIMMEALSYTD